MRRSRADQPGGELVEVGLARRTPRPRRAVARPPAPRSRARRRTRRTRRWSRRRRRRCCPSPRTARPRAGGRRRRRARRRSRPRAPRASSGDGWLIQASGCGARDRRARSSPTTAAAPSRAASARRRRSTRASDHASATTTTSGVPAATSGTLVAHHAHDRATDRGRHRRLRLHRLQHHDRSAGRDPVALAHEQTGDAAVQRRLHHERAVGQRRRGRVRPARRVGSTGSPPRASSPDAAQRVALVGERSFPAARGTPRSNRCARLRNARCSARENVPSSMRRSRRPARASARRSSSSSASTGYQRIRSKHRSSHGLGRRRVALSPVACSTPAPCGRRTGSRPDPPCRRCTGTRRRCRPRSPASTCAPGCTSSSPGDGAGRRAPRPARRGTRRRDRARGSRRRTRSRARRRRRRAR